MNKFYIWIFFILFILIASKFKIKDNKIKYDFTNVNIEINTYVVILYLIICWLLNFYLKEYDLTLYMKPRTLEGLYGIITMGFVHVSDNHLTINTVFVLTYFIIIYLFFNKKDILNLFIFTIIFSGIFVYFFGRDINHGGSSIITYSFRIYIILFGLLSDKNSKRFAIGFVILLTKFSYIFSGVLPQVGISWEGHLGGTIAAILFILNKYRNERNWIK